MDDDYAAIEGLTGDQLAERANALLLEADYWRQVLGDCTKVNDAVLDGTNAVLEATTSALALMMMTGPECLPLVEAIVDQQRRAVEALKAIASALDGMVDLAAGRHKALTPVVGALRRAAGLEPDDGDEADDQ